MIANLLDKMVFAVLLLIFLQFPIVTNEYLHFINGQHQAIKQQVENFEYNAKFHHYLDVKAMITDFKNNSNPAVKADGEQKEQTILQYQQLVKAQQVLTQGNLLDKAIYMLSPNRWDTLQKVLSHFQPGLSLNPKVLVISTLIALILSSFLMWPLKKIFSSQRI